MNKINVRSDLIWAYLIHLGYNAWYRRRSLQGNTAMLPIKSDATRKHGMNSWKTWRRLGSIQLL